MARDLIIVDSCVLIKAFRKDSKALKDLQDIRNQTAYSVVTQLELLFGANTKTKKEAVNKIFDSYYGIHLTPEISSMAIQIKPHRIQATKLYPRITRIFTNKNTS